MGNKFGLNGRNLQKRRNEKRRAGKEGQVRARLACSSPAADQSLISKTATGKGKGESSRAVSRGRRKSSALPSKGMEEEGKEEMEERKNPVHPSIPIHPATLRKRRGGGRRRTGRRRRGKSIPRTIGPNSSSGEEGRRPSICPSSSLPFHSLTSKSPRQSKSLPPLPLQSPFLCFFA